LGGIWAFDVNSIATWKYNCPSMFYINAVQWVGFRRGAGSDADKLVLLIDALGENDLRDAGSTTLIIGVEDVHDECAVRPAHFHLISTSESRQVCELEFAIPAAYSRRCRGLRLHWVYNGDQGRRLSGTDYRPGFLMSFDASAPYNMSKVFSQTSVPLPRGCKRRRFLSKSASYDATAKGPGGSAEAASIWGCIPPEIMQRFRQGSWGRLGQRAERDEEEQDEEDEAA